MNLLVLGGTPSARESVAWSFHSESRLRRGPFVALRAGTEATELGSALLDALGLSSSYAGPSGVLRACEGGTLFVDDIERLPREIQRLLVEFLRHGRSIDAGDFGWAGRLATGSGVNLAALAETGRFHGPLFDALDKIRIDLGPTQ